jgi:hypothetical protein
MNSIISSTALLTGLRATTLAGVVVCLLAATPAMAVPNPFAKYQPDVVVSDPYIEMHTGARAIR